MRDQPEQREAASRTAASPVAFSPLRDSPVRPCTHQDEPPSRARAGLALMLASLVFWMIFSMVTGVLDRSARAQPAPAPVAAPAAGSPGAVAPGAVALVELGGSRAIETDTACLSGADRQWLLGVQARASAQPYGPALMPWTFHPMGGTLYRDLFNTNFFDLDPAPGGLLDWDCTAITYDTHDGIDIALRSFAEQAIGVPVFAVADGTVLAAQDGHPDQNTCGLACTTPANSVALDHGGGYVSIYWHLRNGSVLVAPGEIVPAGHQLGLVGSSGLSTGPHLHFGVYQNGTALEPYAGACRVGASLWQPQTPIRRELYLWDFGLTPQDLTPHPGPPEPLPRDGEFAFGDGQLRIWMLAANLGAASNYTLRLRRPNGTLVANATGGFNNPAYLLSWHWFLVDHPDLHALAGNWRLQILLNGVQHIDHFFEVVASHSPLYNDPPSSVTLTVEPPQPAPADVIVARIGTSLLADDPDLDLVRYRYRWELDGVVLREIESAGHADMLPRGATSGGAVLSCTVTPSDGILDGPSTTLLVPLAGTVTFRRGDCNADGGFNVSDPVFALAALFSGGTPAPCQAACDATDDGAFNIVDAIFLLNALFGQGPLPPPPHVACGLDPTADALACPAFSPCP